MPEKATLCWDVGGNYLTTTNEGLYLSLTEDEIATREKQVRYERFKLENSKWLVCQRKSLETTRECLDKKEFLSRKKSFNLLLEKYFVGDECEIKILRDLRPDNFVLLCLTFTPTLFGTIPEKGLQDNFAEVINGFFEKRWAIPRWVVDRVGKSMEKFKSMDEFKSEADKLQENLDSYLSKKSLPTNPSLNTHSTGVGGGPERQHAESRESLLPSSTSGGRFLPPIPPNYGLNPFTTSTTSTTSTTTTNTEASPTPPNLPQMAEYGHGQQNYNMPQGNQASYSTPNNYMQHETQQPSKRRRVVTPSESYITPWNLTVTPLSTSGQFHGPHFTAHQPGMSSGEVPGNGLGQHNFPRH